MTGRANRDIQTPEGTVEALISALHADDHARASYLERALRIWIEEGGAELSDEDRKRIASAMEGRTERARRRAALIEDEDEEEEARTQQALGRSYRTPAERAAAQKHRRTSSTRASSSGGDARIVLVDGDPETRGTLAQFFADNAEGIDEAEREEIRASLDATGRYDGGGGAAAEYTIELAAAQKRRPVFQRFNWQITIDRASGPTAEPLDDTAPAMQRAINSFRSGNAKSLAHLLKLGSPDEIESVDEVAGWYWRTRGGWHGVFDSRAEAEADYRAEAD